MGRRTVQPIQNGGAGCTRRGHCRTVHVAINQKAVFAGIKQLEKGCLANPLLRQVGWTFVENVVRSYLAAQG